MGACIGVVTSILTRTLEPATKPAPSERARHEAKPRPAESPEPDEPVDEPSATDARDGLVLEEPIELEVPPPGTVVSQRLVARTGGQPVEPVPLSVRVRSALALTVVSVTLGILAAAALGIALVALFTFLRGAVG